MFSSTQHLSTPRGTTVDVAIVAGPAKAGVARPCSAPRWLGRDTGAARNHGIAPIHGTAQDRMNPNLLNCSRGLQGTGAGTFLYERPELKTFAPPLRM